MDIKKTTELTSNKYRTLLITGTCLVIATLSAWSFNQPAGSQKVANSSIWSDSVKRGDLAMQVPGYGKLKSKNQRLISAPTNATVEQIILKPGALVQANSVILRLSNPEIEQQVKDDKRSLATLKTDHSQLELNQKREMLSQQAQLESLSSSLELAKIKLESEQALAGRGIISALNLKRSQLDYRQLSRRLEIERVRLAQLEEIQQQELSTHRDKIEQQREQVAVVVQKLDNLTVKAGIAGVVQSMSIELGQTVTMGEKIALVGSVDELYAMINISQSQMSQVAVDQIAEIDTRAGIVAGFVSRINPMVDGGTVAVEITLTGDLPSNARPELTIDGMIATGLLSNISYVKKPVNAKPGMQTSLYRLSASKQHAEKIDVVYGQESGEYIQVISGANVNDDIILSDMSQWRDWDQLSIVD